MARLMCKTLEVTREEKGSPLQSKLNAFTGGKNIASIRSLALAPGQTDRVTLLYDDDKGGADHDRIYFKVFREDNVQTVKGSKDDDGKETTRESSSVLQTKVNAFSGGDRVESVVHAIAVPDGAATIVIIAFNKTPGEDSDSETSDEAVGAAA